MEDDEKLRACHRLEETKRHNEKGMESWTGLQNREWTLGGM
jgi:hypothetical protein